MMELGRLMHRVHRSRGCWEWLGHTVSGYGSLRFNGRQERAHRVSWMLHKGPIPCGLWVLHRCNNRRCVNPRHLFLGDIHANNADRETKGKYRSYPKWRAYHAKRRARTECSRGHKLSGKNLILHKDGWRRCRACMLAAQRRKRLGLDDAVNK